MSSPIAQAKEALRLTKRLDVLKAKGEPMVARLRAIGVEIDQIQAREATPDNLAKMIALTEEGEALQKEVRAIMDESKAVATRLNTLGKTKGLPLANVTRQQRRAIAREEAKKSGRPLQ